MINGIGNGIAFGDPYTLSDWSRDIATSAVINGGISGITALSQGLNFWDGTNHFVPQFSTVKVEVAPIPDGEINTSNALEGVTGTPEAAVAKLQITKLQIDEGVQFSTRQIPHLSDENLEYMRDNYGGKWNNRPKPREIPPSKVEAPIQQVWDDLKNGNYTVVRVLGDGKSVVHFNYPIGSVYNQSGILVGPSNFAIMQINSAGQVHMWPTVGGF